MYRFQVGAARRQSRISSVHSRKLQADLTETRKQKLEVDKALKISEEKIQQLRKEIETLSRVLSTTSSYTPPPRTPVYVNLDEKSPIKVLKKPLNVPPPPPSKNTTPLVSPLSKLSSISEKSTIKIATKDQRFMALVKEVPTILAHLLVQNIDDAELWDGVSKFFDHKCRIFTYHFLTEENQIL